ncbi:MAG TPA: hypothetical protein VK907_05205, partial [Phnomibacter sp.]|nr:hypothetical protein [Phnomibacter sp.]
MIQLKMDTMKIRIVVLALLVLCANTRPVYAQPSDLPEHVMHIPIRRLNDTQLDAYVYNNDLSKKRPLLLFCQGSGYDSNTEGFLGLASVAGDRAAGLVLEKQGVRYGDDGKQMRDEYRLHNNLHNRLMDALRTLQYLRSHAEWWNGDLYILGGSEGGLLAGLLASFYPQTKAVAILSYGGGMKFGEAWPIAVGLQAEAADSSATAVENAIRSAADSLALAQRQPVYDRSYSGPDNTFAWWHSMMDLRLSNALVDLDIP